MKSLTAQFLNRADSTPVRRPPANLKVRTSLVLFLAVLSLPVGALAETAYSALRVVGARKGEDVLQRVIEVRGDGKQVPETWIVILADPRAKAGVREVLVRNGRITGDSVPKKPRPVGTPMDLTMLNLDSEGVLAVINQETEAATSARRIDYTLSNGAERGTPVWTVKLQPPRAGPVTSMEIAANTGEILARTLTPAADDAQFLGNRESAGELEPRDPATAAAREERADREKPVKKKSSTSRSRESRDNVSDLVDSVANRVGKPVRFLRRFLP